MKKFILIACFVLFNLSTINSQTFKIGASAGIPMADAADVSSFVLGVDAYYYFTDQDAFFEFGLNAGFRNFFGDTIIGDISIDDGQFIPVAAAARLKFFGIFSGGADVGYAFGITDYLDGGFYIRPVVGVDILDILELNLSYENISDEATWGNLNVGFLFQF
jgi:hypothetical protein